MRKLSITLAILFISNLASSQIKDPSKLLFTSFKNEAYDWISPKWKLTNQNTNPLDIYYESGRVFIDNNNSSLYSSYQMDEKQEGDGYSYYQLKCVDKQGTRCLLRVYFDKRGDAYMLAVEYDDVKFIYCKYNL